MKFNKNKENTYSNYGHAKCRITYHIIFSTKYRRICLEPIYDTIIECFKYIESISDFDILMMETDKDHIHFLIKSKPSLSVTQIVRRLKQLSTKYIYDKCYDYMKQYYWKENVLWTHGYFCSTIGNVSENVIKQYIENQG